MITNMTASIIGYLKNGLKIVFLVVVLIVAVKWAQNHPEQAQQMGNKLMNTAAGLFNWALDTIDGLTD